MRDGWKNIFIYSIIALIAVGLLSPFFNRGQSPQDLGFSDFLNKVESGSVKQVQISGDIIKGKLADGKEFKTRAINYPNLVQNLRQKKVDIRVEPPSESGWIVSFLLQIMLPLLFFALLWWLLMRQAQSANNTALSFGRSRAKPFNTESKVTFADVAGVD